MTKLVDAASNGTADSKRWPYPSDLVRHHLLTAYFYSPGDSWDSADATVQISPDLHEEDGGPTDGNSTWFPITNLSAVNTNTVVNFEARFRKIRAVVANGLGSESVTVEIV